VELNHSGDRGPVVAIVAIHELVTDIFAALPERFLKWEYLHAVI
jgi:hypothetical protein